MKASNATARSDRVAAGAGLLFVVMTVVGVAMYPNLPLPYAEAQVQAAYRDRAGMVALSAVLQLLSTIPFVVFLTALWRRLRSIDERLALISLFGGFTTFVMISVWQAVIVGVLIAVTKVDGVDARPVLAVVTAMDQTITLPLGIMAGAAGVAILRDRSLPRWLGWLAILAAVAGIIGVVAILAVFTTEFGSAVAAANPLALLFFLVWVVGLSVHIARSADTGG